MIAPRFSNSKRKATGAHYTPPALARFVAQQIAQVPLPLCPTVLDPAVGNGELLAALLTELGGNALVTGFDTDAEAVTNATVRLRAICSTPIPPKVVQRDFLSTALEHRSLDLFSSTPEKFDVVIANPPYVRTQVMGADAAQRIAREFALNGRVDLYFAFLEGIADVLRAGGVAGIIVSNRFMTTRAGSRVRERILENFDVLHIWDFGDTKLFEAAVLPAVLLLRKSGKPTLAAQPFSSIYTTKEKARTNAPDVFQALAKSGPVEVNQDVFNVIHGTLDYGQNTSSVWRVATEAADAWLKTVDEHTFLTFADIGKIRVGVKTTADKVFVRKNWKEIPESERPEVLRPLVTHDVARRYRSYEPDREILYTHEDRNGKKRPIDLAEYPRTARYLNNHRGVLEARRYVIESGRKWFEIWVPQQPSLWIRPKLVFPDIAEKPTFWMSLSDEIIQGDCYWLAVEDDKTVDLLWLALAVGNSLFIEEFYDRVCVNKLYSGRRRFMTQYVERFPLPNPQDNLSKQIVRSAKEIYDCTPSARADTLASELEHHVRQAFGVEEIVGQRDLKLSV